ncbi:MAG: hypothetical protein JRN54_09350 [Nitrososphaerota archaeon]|jgi:hypothetical protein|nr:hypothetical protein [Nitrososphaerota archaeon]MDG6971293.1 hypothetical protein [Nitrososphaerota archaeon]
MPPLASIWTVDIVVAVASAVLMVWALSFYYGRARRVRSAFSVGLTVFVLIFVIQNVMAVFFYFQLAQTYSADVALPMLALNGLGLAAFVTLVWIIRR